MSRRRQPTILDIAARAGVSHATVSRALAGKPGVTDSTRQAVQDAASELDYQPNRVAQGLVHGSSTTIAVAAADLASPFFGQILAGIQTGITGSGYHTLVCGIGHDGEEATAVITELRQRRVDCLISLGDAVDDETLRHAAGRLPVLVLLRAVTGVCHLTFDNRAAAALATKHLLDLGHRRIVHLTGTTRNCDAPARIRGFYDALSAAGLTVGDGDVLEGDYTESSGYLRTRSLLDRQVIGPTGVTAVFCGNDQIAIGATAALHEAGLRVPDDVSLVGFDDQPVAAYLSPPLTTVRQPAHEIGHAGARMALAMAAAESISPPRFDPELVVRRSTAPPANATREMSVMPGG